MLESSAALCPELGLSTTHCPDHTMEKNPSTSTKPPPRSSSTGPAPGESKPKAEGKNNGGFKRYSRKREPSCPKSEGFPGPRRPASQKSKNFDKRPPQRGSGRPYGVPAGGRREEVAEAQRAEFSPAQFGGPKKISLNHLLNFTFEPRGAHGGTADRGHSYWGRRNKWGHKHKPFNKELFLQANCQFVVSDDQDYKAHFTDPDTLVNWDCVQQVRICSQEMPSCPICLYSPLAARITRCGHIFCWPCMLHYLSLEDRNWAKCPICYQAVHTADLKSVVAMETRQYVVGDVISMRLMRREKGAVVAMPSAQWVKVEEPVRFGDAGLSPYSKLLLTSSAQVLSLLAEEKAVLQDQLRQEEEAQACFIQAALCLLQEREELLLKQQKSGAADDLELSSLTLAEAVSAEDEVVTTSSSNSQPLLQYSSAFDDEVEEFLEEQQSLEEAAEVPAAVLDSVLEEPPENHAEPELQLDASRSVPGRPAASSVHGPFYYFYQADDCQQIFLHPINVRCLVREYGSLEASPDLITATVVEIEGHTVSEEIRRHHRYLAHLPLTCEFRLCELALQQPVLSKETLDTFAEDLDKRRRLRQKKAREEKRREKRIEMEENKKQGKYPEVQIAFENLQHFPAFGSPPSSPPVPPDLTFDPPLPHSSSPSDEVKQSMNSESSSAGVDDEYHCVSFAQMLRDGKARADSGPRSTPKKDCKLLAPPAADSDGESDGSDRVPVPSFQNSFSQAIEKALLQLDSVPSVSPQSVPPPDDKSGKKKKKKQKLLFSTSMVHTK